MEQSSSSSNTGTDQPQPRTSTDTDPNTEAPPITYKSRPFTCRTLSPAEQEARWLVTDAFLDAVPSRRDGMTAADDMRNRSQAAAFIQDIGQRVRVSQLCINTAVVYMQRFYLYHSFAQFPPVQVATAALFSACKNEDTPRGMRDFVCARFLATGAPVPSGRSNPYLCVLAELRWNETVMLQTFGFYMTVRHPHVMVIQACERLGLNKTLSWQAYHNATNSLHLTTWCVQRRPELVACACVYVACQQHGYVIPPPGDGERPWYAHIDIAANVDMLEQMGREIRDRSSRHGDRPPISREQIAAAQTELREAARTVEQEELEGMLKQHERQMQHKLMLAEMNPPPPLPPHELVAKRALLNSILASYSAASSSGTDTKRMRSGEQLPTTGTADNSTSALMAAAPLLCARLSSAPAAPSSSSFAQPPDYRQHFGQHTVPMPAHPSIDAMPHYPTMQPADRPSAAPMASTPAATAAATVASTSSSSSSSSDDQQCYHQDDQP